MTVERWQQIKQVLAATLEKDPEEREAWLAQTCADDPALADEVRSLVAAHEAVGDLLDHSPVAEADTLEPGRRIGPYRVVEEIGRGGMGAVYRCVRADDSFRKQVAIKVVKRGMDHEYILRRFRNERQILATLEHPYIARLLDGGSTEDGSPYFVMEYIEGKPIDVFCKERGLDVPERLRLFLKVCSAVEYAHENLIIHRDVKPGNILITAAGIPKLLDFGIAKILNPELSAQTADATATLLRLMTPEYASPEQVRGQEITAASDTYSLGVLLYELLAGERPYRVESRAPHEVAAVICDQEPERPSARRKELAGDLDNIVMMAMRKEPGRRYDSVAQLAEDVRRHLDGRPVRARKDTVRYRTAKFLRRNRTTVLAAAAAALGALALIVTALVWSPSGSLPFRPAPPAPAISPLTSLAGDETQASISPDGTRLLFSWGGEDNRNTDVYVQTLGSSSLLRLTTNPAEDVSAVWSPDGSRIAFLRTSRTETAIFFSPAGGGVHGKVADLYPNRLEAVGRHLSWSPDGRYLAASDRSAPEEPFRIVLVRAANGQKQPITSPPANFIGDSSPAFSPDGKWLAFIRAPSSGVSDLYVTAADGTGEPRRLTFDHRYMVSQGWTADSRALIFSSNRGGGQTLWRVSIHGGVPQRIPGVGTNVSEPSVARDGKRLVYSQAFQDTNIWRFDITRRSPMRPLIVSTQYDSSPQYSPDGKRIAFRSSRSGHNEIWVADSEGHNPVQVTHVGGSLTGTPRWSPDGRYIACDSRPEGQADIFVIPAGGGEPRRLTTNLSEDVVPSWSRDGRWIYFASSRGGAWQVWKKPWRGGDAVQVTRNGGFAAFESPDGKYLYYAKGRSLPGLWRVPVNGGEETVVLERLRPAYWGYWAVRDEGIYFVDDPTGDGRPAIYLFRFTTRETTRLAPIEKRPIPGDSALAVSPDGRFILFTQVDQSGSDIMLAQSATPW